MKLITILFINFCIGFISDIILNDLSKIKNLRYFNSLDIYFENNYITIAAIYAGLTTMICVLITLLLNKYLLINYYMLSFFVGYFADIIIEKYKLFNHLEEYYKLVGSGYWGGVAILFSTITSSFINNILGPIIYDCR